VKDQKMSSPLGNAVLTAHAFRNLCTAISDAQFYINLLTFLYNTLCFLCMYHNPLRK